MDDAELSLKEHAAREDAYASQVLNTAKLVTTFSAALAATFLATALQVGKPTFLDYFGAWAMLPVLLITVGTVVLRKATLKPSDLLSKYDAEKAGIPEPDSSELHTRFIKNARKNLCRARWVHGAMIAQLIGSSVICAVAVIEILLWLN